MITQTTTMKYMLDLFLVALLFACHCSSLSDTYQDISYSKKWETQELSTDNKWKETENKYASTKCYQCAYTPNRTETEEIKVPRIVKEEIQTPKIIQENTKVPRILWEEVQRPRVIEEEDLYLDKSAWKWKVGKKTRQVYERVWVSKQVFEDKQVTKQTQEKTIRTKQVFDVKTVTKQKFGGWGKCMGPFDERQAREWGIDEWDCENNCYTKVDKNGNVVRGCYKDEFGVDPNLLGCDQKVAGARYCFCQGDYCNKDASPEY